MESTVLKEEPNSPVKQEVQLEEQENLEDIDLNTDEINLDYNIKNEKDCKQNCENTADLISVSGENSDFTFINVKQEFDNVPANNIDCDPEDSFRDTMINTVKRQGGKKCTKTKSAKKDKQEQRPVISVEVDHIVSSVSKDFEVNNSKQCIIKDIFQRPFNTLSDSEKQHVVLSGRPTPSLPNLIRSKKVATGKIVNLTFSCSKYEEISWLCGSVTHNKLYCWPCLLFCPQKNSWNHDGIVDLNNITVLRKRHQQTKEHITAYIALKEFEKSANKSELHLSEAYKESIEQHNCKVRNNRYVMKCLIDAATFLALQGIPFQYQGGSETSISKSNFRELVNFMAERDANLQFHLQNFSNFFELPLKIQNDIIQACTKHLICYIKEEISVARFVAILVGEVMDKSKKPQLYTVFRYVDSKGMVQERFVSFHNASSNRSAEEILQHVLRHIEEFNCSNKLVSQTYYGCCTNTYQDKLLVARVKIKCPQAIFTISSACQLDMALQDSVMIIEACNNFFVTLSGLTSFFTNSSERNYELDKIIHSHFQFVAPTEWSCNTKLVRLLHSDKQEFVQLFDHIIENATAFDSETVYCAEGFRRSLLDLQFHFLLEMFHMVFLKTEILSDVIQKNLFNILLCLEKIKEFKIFLNDIKNEFKTVWDKVTLIEPQNTSTESCKKRHRSEDDRTSKKALFQHLYSEIVAKIIDDVNERFADFHRLQFFSLLDCTKFKEYSQTLPQSLLKSLTNSQYGTYFHKQTLSSELLFIYSSPSFHFESVYELNEYLMAEDLYGILPEASKLIHLILTIPTSYLPAEKNSSALSRLRSFCRNSAVQDNPKGLASIVIENKLLKKLKENHLFHDTVTDILAKNKSTIDLIYK